MNKNLVFNTTVMHRSAAVVPAYSHVMGDVCPQTAIAGNSAAWLKRRTTVAFVATTPGSGLPWSPPVT